jgi:phosphatidylglycerol---prolipoprotein diacylglyceryl transferase
VTHAVSLVGAIGWEVLDRIRFGSSFAISPHGLGIAIGYLAGAVVFIRESRKRGYPEEVASSVIFWALIGTLIGARLGYVITHLSDYTRAVDVLKVWQGGISQLGGVVGAIIVSAVVVRRERRRRGIELSLLKGLDAAAIPIALGVVIGRVGDLIIGDHLGKPTSWLLAFQYHGGNLAGYTCDPTGTCRTFLSGGNEQVITHTQAVLSGPTGAVISQGVGVNQTALYDFLLTMGLVLLLVAMNRFPRRAGIIFFTYVIWYGVGRIITDFLRVENRFFGLTGSQWTSVAAVTFAVVMLVWFALHPSHRDGAGDEQDDAAAAAALGPGEHPAAGGAGPPT